nr:immunoglobulin light chain junction region [Macaca mulatta]
GYYCWLHYDGAWVF